jgi:RNA polymerase sigma-70 factor (ECF subfamily)
MNAMHPARAAEDEARALARTDREAALALLVRLHRARLHRHASAILHDDDAAHDVVQEAFVRAMREERLFNQDFRIGAWLHRVTANLCFNSVRDRRRRGDLLAGLGLPSTVGPSQADAVLATQRERHLRRLLGRLSPDHRAILQERYYNDGSYGEIAESLQLKLGTVMSRLSRAKDALTELLDPALAAGL